MPRASGSVIKTKEKKGQKFKFWECSEPDPLSKNLVFWLFLHNVCFSGNSIIAERLESDPFVSRFFRVQKWLKFWKRIAKYKSGKKWLKLWKPI